jgi:hypothetical protein
MEIEETYNIIIKYKDKILKNKDWYIRTIPESKWLIDHLELMQDTL